ncbi:hypothetical protein B0H13DRAFT_1851033 [Mycena leptocephala]|nr:hypothetical protein B0H13DRAFT_1851033 [Mycena leptocephala]
MDDDTDVEDLDTYGEDQLMDMKDKVLPPGPIYMAREELMRQAENIVTSSGWINRVKVPDTVPGRVVPKSKFSTSQWKIEIAKEQADILEAKYKNAPNQDMDKKPQKVVESVKSDPGVKLL